MAEQLAIRGRGCLCEVQLLGFSSHLRVNSPSCVSVSGISGQSVVTQCWEVGMGLGAQRADPDLFLGVMCPPCVSLSLLVGCFGWF